MSRDVENYLCNYLQTTSFAIIPDESTSSGNETLWLTYLRFIMHRETHEELLVVSALSADTEKAN